MVVSSMTRGNYDGDLTQLIIWSFAGGVAYCALAVPIWLRHEFSGRWAGGWAEVLLLPACVLSGILSAGFVTLLGLTR